MSVTVTKPYGTPIVNFRCIICSSIEGEMRGNGNEDWRWYTCGQIHGGPFCSETCAITFSRLSFNEQFTTAFGSLDAALYFAYLVEGGRVQRPNVAPSITYLMDGLKTDHPGDKVTLCSSGSHDHDLACKDCRTYLVSYVQCNLDILLSTSKESL